jgi:broad specificity phosphatase PhoE
MNDGSSGDADRAVDLTTNVFLVRHGAHAELGRVLTGRGAGVPLTADGRAEAEAVAERLGREQVRAVHTSPRERAVETASIIAARLGIAIEIVEALDEIDFGGWSGRSFASLAGDPAWQQWNAHRGSAATPDGETMAAAVARAAGHVTSLVADGGGVVCVSHCDIIRGLIADTIGLPLDNLLRFDIDTASLSTLMVGDWGRRVVSMNERVPA